MSSRLWRRDEHLLLAAYIIPRIALVRLASAGHYVLTEHDREELAAFELLLCLNNVFGEADDGSAVGLPPRFGQVHGRYAWREALRLTERERFMLKFFREHNIAESGPPPES